jgi:hypothetical protein
MAEWSMAVVLKTPTIGYIRTVIFCAVRSSPDRQNLAKIRAISGILERNPITDRLSPLENTPKLTVSLGVRDTASDTQGTPRFSAYCDTTARNYTPRTTILSLRSPVGPLLKAPAHD